MAESIAADEKKKTSRRKYTLKKKPKKKKHHDATDRETAEVSETFSSRSSTENSEMSGDFSFHQQQQSPKGEENQLHAGRKGNGDRAEVNDYSTENIVRNVHQEENNGMIKPPQPSPVSATDLYGTMNGDVKYAVNEKGEYVQFSIDEQGVPELWLQVDHSKCLVSPMTVNSPYYPNSSSSSQRSSAILSHSKKHLMMKTSLLSVDEHMRTHPTPKKLIGEEDESTAAEERFLSQYQHLNVNNEATKSILSNKSSHSEKGKASGDGSKKKKKKEKQKKHSGQSSSSGDEEEHGARAKGTRVNPSTKIRSQGQRSSNDLSYCSEHVPRTPVRLVKPSKSRSLEPKPSPKNPHSSKHGKKTSISKKDKKTEKSSKKKELSPKSHGETGKVVNKSNGYRKVRRSTSMPPSAPPKEEKRIEATAPLLEKPQPGVRRSVSHKTYSHTAGPRMGLRELRDRFGSDRSLRTDGSGKSGGGAYVEMPTELQAYGLPAEVKKARPGLQRKEYQMSQRSLRNLDPESSDDDDDKEDLVKYLTSSYNVALKG
eukprot:scaffold1089_cov117-Cylindrotheca_fusiformis.AAC.11